MKWERGGGTMKCLSTLARLPAACWGIFHVDRMQLWRLCHRSTCRWDLWRLQQQTEIYNSRAQAKHYVTLNSLLQRIVGIAGRMTAMMRQKGSVFGWQCDVDCSHKSPMASDCSMYGYEPTILRVRSIPRVAVSQPFWWQIRPPDSTFRDRWGFYLLSRTISFQIQQRYARPQSQAHRQPEWKRERVDIASSSSGWWLLPWESRAGYTNTQLRLSR